MRCGKFVQIPERPADISQIWERAAPLDPANLPDWLTPGDAGEYRYVEYASSAGLSITEKEGYLAELRELEETGLIIDPDPIDPQPDAHRVFVGAPCKEPVWSIGIYCGESPFDLRPPAEVSNPVLTCADVSDVPAVFVADPFMIRVGDIWHMLFEVMNWRARKGEIGLATSRDGLNWKYQQIVLAEEFHMSYPYVFEWKGEYYLIPESYQASAVRLYHARNFPTEWEFVGSLLRGPYFADPSVFRYRDRWWLFVETNRKQQDDTLRLFHAGVLTGPWVEHPKSPVIRDNAHIARPAGRVLVLGDRLIRYAQSCEPAYGLDVRAFEITELSTTSYQEREVRPNPVLGPSGSGWNAGGMHHVDPHPIGATAWLACVDGWH